MTVISDKRLFSIVTSDEDLREVALGEREGGRALEQREALAAQRDLLAGGHEEARARLRPAHAAGARGLRWNGHSK